MSNLQNQDNERKKASAEAYKLYKDYIGVFHSATFKGAAIAVSVLTLAMVFGSCLFCGWDSQIPLFALAALATEQALLLQETGYIGIMKNLARIFFVIPAVMTILLLVMFLKDVDPSVMRWTIWICGILLLCLLIFSCLPFYIANPLRLHLDGAMREAREEEKEKRRKARAVKRLERQERKERNVTEKRQWQEFLKSQKK